MRILLADDDSNVLVTLPARLRWQLGVRIVSRATSSAELLGRIRQGCPDLVLLDWELSGCSAVTRLCELREICPSMAVVVLSGRPEARREVLDAGADALESKVDSPDVLLEAVRSVRQVAAWEGLMVRKEDERCSGGF